MERTDARRGLEYFEFLCEAEMNRARAWAQKGIVTFDGAVEHARKRSTWDRKIASCVALSKVLGEHGIEVEYRAILEEVKGCPT